VGGDSLWDDRPGCHSYCYGAIQLFVNLILHGPASIRGASGILSILASQLLVREDTTPSPNSGCNWLLRLGLYELTRPLAQADDWFWIVDHTVQIGTVKCLVIVGCRVSVWQDLQRPLRHQDLSVIALEPAQSSNSAVVLQVLEKSVARVGVPRAILSDGAVELKRAIEDFREAHPQTANLYDVKHKVAIFLKRELEDDPRWKEFIKQAAASRSQLSFDPLVYLAPPTPKHKARYMNLGELATWAVKVRRFLAAPRSPDGEPINMGKLNITLGWLRQYDAAIADWQALLGTADMALDFLRTNGYHAQAAQELAPRLDRLAVWSASRQLADNLLEFVSQQSTCVLPGERLPASSEVLESLIGRGKRLEGQQSSSGFTKMVIGMAAAVTKPTKEFIEQAFEAVKTKDVIAWGKKKLGTSVQACRYAALAPATSGTKAA
jgi:hypothetical protein